MVIKASSVSIVGFALIILCFFLPFLEIKCNKTSLASVKGIELASGYQVGGHKTDSLNAIRGIFDSLPKGDQHNSIVPGGNSDPASEKMERNNFATAALLLAICGLVLSFLMKWRRTMLMSIIGLFGGMALLLMRIQLDQSLNKQPSDSENALMKIEVSIDYLAAYWVVLVLFLLIAVVNIYEYIQQRRIPRMKISEGLPLR